MNDPPDPVRLCVWGSMNMCGYDLPMLAVACLVGYILFSVQTLGTNLRAEGTRRACGIASCFPVSAYLASDIDSLLRIVDPSSRGTRAQPASLARRRSRVADHMVLDRRGARP